jgi:hypothetical protein
LRLGEFEPSKGCTSRGAFVATGNNRPLDFIGSGSYCNSRSINLREPIRKQANTYPLAWYISVSYYVKSR